MIKKILVFLCIIINLTGFAMEEREFDAKEESIERKSEAKRKRESGQELDIEVKRFKTTYEREFFQKENELLEINTFAGLPAELRLLIMQFLIECESDCYIAVKNLQTFIILFKSNSELLEINVNIFAKMLLNKYGLLPIFSFKKVPDKFNEAFKKLYSDEEFMKLVVLGSNIFIESLIIKITKHLEELENFNNDLWIQWTNWLGIDYPEKINTFKEIIFSLTCKSKSLVNDFILEEKIEARVVESFLKNILLCSIDKKIRIPLAHKLYHVLQILFSIKRNVNNYEFFEDRRHKLFEIINKLSNVCDTISEFGKSDISFTSSFFSQSDPLKIKKKNMALTIRAELKDLALNIIQLKKIAKIRWNSWQDNLSNFYRTALNHFNLSEDNNSQIVIVKESS